MYELNTSIQKRVLESDKFYTIRVPQNNYTLQDRILRAHCRIVIPKILAELL